MPSDIRSELPLKITNLGAQPASVRERAGVLLVEGFDNPGGWLNLEPLTRLGLRGDHPNSVAEHVVLREEAGFLDATINRTFSGAIYAIRGLTWEGHEFLHLRHHEGVAIYPLGWGCFSHAERYALVVCRSQSAFSCRNHRIRPGWMC